MLIGEFTSTPDLETTREVLDVIRSLAESGMTMLIVTNAAKFVEKVAHRVLLMDEGQILEEATPKKFFQNPTEERSRQFLAHLALQSFLILKIADRIDHFLAS